MNKKIITECKVAEVNSEKAYLRFDAGYNNVSQILKYESEETDYEYQQRTGQLENDAVKKLKEKEDRRKTYEKLWKEFEEK